MDIAKLNQLIKPSGTMAISNKSRELLAEGKPVIQFAAGEPDFPTPDYVIDAVKRAAENPKNHKYSPAAGLESLRKEISNSALLYSEYNVDPNNIVVTNGGKQAILTALFSILNRDDEVLIPTPYWTTYPEAVKIVGGKPVFVNTQRENNFKVTIEELDKFITSNTKLLIWCSPSNPTGVVYSKQESENIYNWVIKNNIWILSDELYEHLVYEGKTSPSPALYDKVMNNTIIVNGVSKAYSMTGWRVGWIISNEKVINLAKKIQSQGTSNVANITQLAAEEALKKGLDFTNKMKVAFNRRRLKAIQLIESIPNLSLLNGTGAFYLFVDVSYYCDGNFNNLTSSEEFCNWLLEEYYIAFVPGEVFGTSGFMRLSYALSDSELEDGLGRLKEAIKQLNG